MPIRNFLRLIPLLAALVVVAACGDDEDGEDGEGGFLACTPGQQSACACTDGSTGAQTCTDDGARFDACVCAGTEDVGGADSSTGDDTSTADTGATEDIAQSDAAEDAADATPDDTVAADVADAEGSDATGEDTTPPAPIFVAYAADQGLPWADMGMIGFDAGVSLCRQAATVAEVPNADSVTVCEYQQVLAADAAGEFAAFTAGEEAWLHRTSVAMVMEVESQPGPGGRCNDWLCSECNHIADGEVVVFGEGVVAQYQLDNDTTYDPANPGPHVQPGLLPCDGQRHILCCNPPTE